MAKAWESGNSRRRIRQIAGNVKSTEASGSPEPATWGKQAKVQTIAIDVLLSRPLISDWRNGGVESQIPPEPSDPLEVDILAQRVCDILTELFSGSPYGPLRGCQTSIEWEQWTVKKERRQKVEHNWIGTTQHSDCKALTRETKQRIEALLQEGAAFALPHSRETRPTPKFAKSGSRRKRPIDWIQVPRLSIRWTVSPKTWKPRAT